MRKLRRLAILREDLALKRCGGRSGSPGTAGDALEGGPSPRRKGAPSPSDLACVAFGKAHAKRYARPPDASAPTQRIVASGPPCLATGPWLRDRAYPLPCEGIRRGALEIPQGGPCWPASLGKSPQDEPTPLFFNLFHLGLRGSLAVAVRPKARRPEGALRHRVDQLPLARDGPR